MPDATPGLGRSAPRLGELLSLQPPSSKNPSGPWLPLSSEAPSTTARPTMLNIDLLTPLLPASAAKGPTPRNPPPGATSGRVRGRGAEMPVNPLYYYGHMVGFGSPLPRAMAFPGGNALAEPTRGLRKRPLPKAPFPVRSYWEPGFGGAH